MTLARREKFHSPPWPGLQPLIHVSAVTCRICQLSASDCSWTFSDSTRSGACAACGATISPAAWRGKHRLTADDLIYPVFVIEGRNAAQPVPSMPGVERLTLDRLLPVAEECLKLRIPALALFPAIEPVSRPPDGKEAANPDGLIPRIVAALKKQFPELGVMTDVALDPYTSHGQDGVHRRHRLHPQ